MPARLPGSYLYGRMLADAVAHPPLAIPSQGHMRLKPFSLLLCLLTLSCPALAMGKSVYGLNEYIYIEELDLQVAAKLDITDCP